MAMTHPLEMGVFVAALLLAGCSEPSMPIPLFKQGDIVEFVISSQRAQIIDVNYCHPRVGCTYEVRMTAPQILTDTHLLSSDGALHGKSLARLDFVREYELRMAKQ